VNIASTTPSTWPRSPRSVRSIATAAPFMTKDPRGQDTQRSAARPQMPDQRRHLQAPERRRCPRRQSEHPGSGRPRGERQCRARPPHTANASSSAKALPDCPHPAVPAPPAEDNLTPQKKGPSYHLTQRGSFGAGAGTAAFPEGGIQSRSIWRHGPWRGVWRNPRCIDRRDRWSASGWWQRRSASGERVR